MQEPVHRSSSPTDMLLESQVLGGSNGGVSLRATWTLGGAGDRTGDLPVTGRPAVPRGSTCRPLRPLGPPERRVRERRRRAGCVPCEHRVSMASRGSARRCDLTAARLSASVPQQRGSLTATPEGAHRRHGAFRRLLLASKQNAERGLFTSAHGFTVNGVLLP